jgi:cytochrome c oxidase cbb3-type subunit I/II
MSKSSEGFWHRSLEGKATLFTVLTTIAISIGGLVEIVPMFSVDLHKDGFQASVYSPLELAGRDIYIREGCYVCHSQMVRPMRAETLRYGEWSRAWEYEYDRPFQLGSRRIGPDLARVGGKYNDAWHYEHMRDPRATTVGSIMPPYSWLHEWQVDPADVAASMVALKALGHPYGDTSVDAVKAELDKQAGEIVGRLKESKIDTAPDREIVAVIAYLQRLGKDAKAQITNAPKAAAIAPVGEPVHASAGGAQ